MQACSIQYPTWRPLGISSVLPRIGPCHAHRRGLTRKFNYSRFDTSMQAIYRQKAELFMKKMALPVNELVGCKKKTWLYDRGKKLKPLLEYKAMSTSMLYHTFGIRSIQHRCTDFLTARRSSTVPFTPTRWSAHVAEAGM